MELLNHTYRRIYEGMNFRLRTLAGGRLSHLCRPVSTVILLTERCNARCIHCDIWKNKGREDSPDLDQWKQVFKDLRDWLGPVQVVLSGGEAMLKRYALDLVEYGSSIGLFIELLTHGYWDDEERFERLALAKPGRVTFSFDGVGDTHSLVRGRDGFFAKTAASIQALRRARAGNDLDFVIRLKTVVMDQNVDSLTAVAEFAGENGLEVFYQPIEQNYNTEEDPDWFSNSLTWPREPETAVEAIGRLISLKQQGLPIVNSLPQLEAMINYFRDPRGLRVATQAHAAHEKKTLCSAMTMLQIQANGDVRPCSVRESVGNIKTESIRKIWEERPRWWLGDCCLSQRIALTK